ncbi:TetR/AcrR family transcriptional regulator [Planococcus salinus]|uniref:TetR/AcrR family transcriptional regulator n=1 Tax=Planococcus salinus TaxID=1848460 RepID=A0A3M8P6A0_9BACL|nr:TetR/AcrR family transcriptional regulator [Planococcus salinus]RNF38734.1 TetR/AcrR family transcriptional regulator [Planococcus salinus]
MEKFENLEMDKQQKILESAMKEFAEKGFEQASTNRIVKEAGIGKGMLFYYFNSKRDLYEYLLAYCMDIVVNEYFQLVDTSEADFIERLRHTAEVKMEVQAKHKYVFNFMGTFMLKKEEDLPAHLQKRYEELYRLGNALLYEGIDTSLFRNDIDTEKAFKLIRWSIEGYQNELLVRLEGQKMTEIDLDVYWQEFYEYLDILKKSFYKEGESGR